MKLEMMNGTERITEALQTRGLFVRLKDEVIILTAENTAEDVKKVRALLHDLNISTYWQESNKFQVLVNRIPVSMMKKIIYAPGSTFPVSMEGYHFRWRSFVQRRFGIKVNALDLDANIAMFVKTLNLSGITALSGCNGHHRYSPNVQLSGVFQGSWFAVIQEKYLSECSLHYRWNVHFGNGSGSSIIAEKQNDERWDMNWIYQDTVQMAEVLKKYASDIRELKKKNFKRDGEMKETAKCFVVEKDYQGLVGWMRVNMEIPQKA